MRGKHTQARDQKARKNQKARKSEQDKHGQWGKSTHILEPRRQEKVSKTNRGEGKKHAQPRDKKRREGKKNMGVGEKQSHPRDEKARKSEQDRHGRLGKSTHILETRRQEKVSRTNMGNGGKAHTS
ncbi:hypothetical protein B0H16DRAFT_1481052 [Mycena metata]|uniref:Uncharacterized protein n=1 Tax=Mycena metata TaxID=1033252 RepID=A0AAD7MBD5_9AGAR|nr:hypothetical protein B0H16DRAFT_1481052 [Mycena metata]